MNHKAAHTHRNIQWRNIIRITTPRTNTSRETAHLCGKNCKVRWNFKYISNLWRTIVVTTEIRNHRSSYSFEIVKMLRVLQLHRVHTNASIQKHLRMVCKQIILSELKKFIFLVIVFYVSQLRCCLQCTLQKFGSHSLVWYRQRLCNQFTTQFAWMIFQRRHYHQMMMTAAMVVVAFANSKHYKIAEAPSFQ